MALDSDSSSKFHTLLQTDGGASPSSGGRHHSPHPMNGSYGAAASPYDEANDATPLVRMSIDDAPMGQRMSAFFTALVFNVNVIMGSGALAIPFAFYAAGWALGAGVLVLIAFLSYVTICYNFEAQMRAFMLADAYCRGLVRFKRSRHVAQGEIGSGNTSQYSSMHTVQQHISSGAISDSALATAPQPIVPAFRNQDSNSAEPRSPRERGLSPIPSQMNVQRSRGGSVSGVGGTSGEANLSGGLLPPNMSGQSSLAHTPTFQIGGSTPPLEIGDVAGVPVDDGASTPALRAPPSPEPQSRDVTAAPSAAASPTGPLLGAAAPLREAEQSPMSVLLEAAKAAAAEYQGFFTVPVLERISAGTMEDPKQPPADFKTFDVSEFWEINDVLLLFGGKVSVWGWNVCNVIFQLSVLWVFSVVLGQTAVLGIPIPGFTTRLQCNANHPHFEDTGNCMNGLRLWFLFFGVVNAILVAQDWAIMAKLQKAFAALVYVSITIIFVTCIIAMFQHNFPGTNDTKSGNAYVQHIKPFKPNGFASLFGVAIFAMLCHSATSFILRQMPSANMVKSVFKASFGLITIMYLGLGFIVAFYMGSEVEKVATLDWSIYREWGAHSWIGTAVGSIVLFFPILSVTPGFVLRTRSLTDAMETMVPLRIRMWITEKILRGEYRPSLKGNVYRFQVMLRMVTVSISVTMSLISYHFGQAVTVAGFAGFTILFLFPMLSQFRSRWMLRHAGFYDASPYDDITGTMPVSIFMGVFGIIAFFYDFASHYIIRNDPG